MTQRSITAVLVGALSLFGIAFMATAIAVPLDLITVAWLFAAGAVALRIGVEIAIRVHRHRPSR